MLWNFLGYYIFEADRSKPVNMHECVIKRTIFLESWPWPLRIFKEAASFKACLVQKNIFQVYARVNNLCFEFRRQRSIYGRLLAEFMKFRPSLVNIFHRKMLLLGIL